MRSIKYRKVFLLIGITVSMLTLLYIISGCADNSPGSAASIDIFTTTGTTHSETILPTPIPTVNDNKIFEQIEEKSLLAIVNGNSKTVVLGKQHIFDMQGVFDSVGYSGDSTKAAILFDRNTEGTGRLVFIDGTVETEVADDVESFLISYDGSAIAYLSGSFLDGVGCDLYVFDCVTGASRLIAEKSGRYFALSPHGDAIAFTEYENSGDVNSLVCSVSVNGDTPTVISKGIYPGALTDDGSLVYAIRLGSGDNNKIIANGLSVFKGTVEVVLSKSLYASNYMNMIFNEDCTQILYCDAGGICFSHDGEEAVQIEPYAKIALTNVSCKTDVWSLSGDMQYAANYSGTKNLYNVLQMIFYDKSDTANLWYFTETDRSVVLTAIERKTGYASVGNSILAYNQKELIYIRNIFSQKYENEYDVSEEKHFQAESGSNFILTANDTIYYSSAGGTADKNYQFTMSSIKADGSSAAVLISSSCVRMEKFEREGKPDIIYYLAYSEPESVKNEKKYISQYYYNLFMIEDVPGALPVLIAENVGNFEIGDYGVYYLQLKDVAPKLIQYYAGQGNHYDEYQNILDEDLYDQNKLYYSAAGTSFEYVTDIGRRYLYGG